MQAPSRKTEARARFLDITKNEAEEREEKNGVGFFFFLFSSRIERLLDLWGLLRFFFFSVFGFCLCWICVVDCLHLFFFLLRHITTLYVHMCTYTHSALKKKKTGLIALQ